VNVKCRDCLSWSNNKRSSIARKRNMPKTKTRSINFANSPLFHELRTHFHTRPTHHAPHRPHSNTGATARARATEKDGEIP